MNSDIFQTIYNHPSLKNEDYSKIKKAHSKLIFSKNDIILKEGKISKAYYLIETGLFRSYVINYNGKEVTTDFYSSNEILIEVASIFLGIPTKENLQALTHGVAWKIDFQSFQELYNGIAGFTEWGRTWMSSQLFAAKQRSINMLTQSATQRYLTLVRDQPQIIEQVPLKFIASYLGITDTSLSRIRKEISKVR